MRRAIAAAATTAMMFGMAVTGVAADRQAVINEASSAAPDEIARGATIKDWDGNTLQEGSNGYTCFPTPPSMDGTAPMCLDEPWLAWADAWMNKKPFEGDRVGTAYMLAGDAGTSNIDPYAKEPTPDNQWVQEGPHLMILVPDPAALEGVPTDPENGGPYVMWKGTPYAHIMVPTTGK